VRWSLVAIALLATSASAFAHDGYENLRDSRGNSCCNDADCRAVHARVDSEGDWEIYVKELDKYVRVPSHAILKTRMSDERCHACYKFIKGYSLAFYCFVPCDVKI